MYGTTNSRRACCFRFLALAYRPFAKRMASLFFLTLVVAYCDFATVPASFGAPPNIVLILVDDMGVMDTSVPFLADANGLPQRYPLNEFYRTPNMERLAQNGIRFNQFCAMSVCSPTRVSIMTGQNAARHRTTNWINPNQNNSGPSGPLDWNWHGLRKDSITLPKILQSAGYRTMHVGKGHFGPLGSDGADPTNIGFDSNIAGGAAGHPKSYYGTQNFGNPTNGQPIPFDAVRGLEQYHGTETFLTEALTLEAKKLVSQAIEDDKPFFLYFAHYAVHSPFHSDPRFAAHYQNADKPANARAFATLIEGMDKSLGDILDHLIDKGVAEDTLILFLGDNGSDAPLGHEHAVACAAPLRGRKGSHYEGGTRVPFIAAWASPSDTNEHQRRFPIATGKIQSQIAAVYDIFPTVLEIANCQVPTAHTQDGTSLTTLFQGKSDPARSDRFLMHFPHAPHRSNYFTTYRNGRHKVIYHYFPSAASEDSHYQLFDLAEDPFEQSNLAQSQPAILRQMMEELIDALHSQSATYPVDASGNALRPALPNQPNR